MTAITGGRIHLHVSFKSARTVNNSLSIKRWAALELIIQANHQINAG
jgi:hypothetical protein